MKDDSYQISLYLDGQLEAGPARVLRQRLERDPELSEEMERARRLQDLASGLRFTRGSFGADDVRERLGARAGGRRYLRRGLAAAAVVALAMTHLAAYRLGADGGAGAGTPPATTIQPRRLSEGVFEAIEETERLFQRAARVDARTPYDQLHSELDDLHASLVDSRLPFRLTDRSQPGLPEADRRRATELADGLVQLETAFEQRIDPGFMGLLVARIGREYLEGMPAMRVVPSSASNYLRVAPLGEGRWKVRILVVTGEGARFEELEGTAEELRERNVEIRVMEGE